MCYHLAKYFPGNLERERFMLKLRSNNFLSCHATREDIKLRPRPCKPELCVCFVFSQLHPSPFPVFLPDAPGALIEAFSCLRSFSPERAEHHLKAIYVMLKIMIWLFTVLRICKAELFEICRGLKGFYSNEIYKNCGKFAKLKRIPNKISKRAQQQLRILRK